MPNNSYYQNSIKDFVTDNPLNILQQLAWGGTTEGYQKDAWEEEISILQQQLNSFKEESNSWIIFEYTVPRFNKRIDVVVHINGVIFVLEFKAGKAVFVQKDIDQVMDYTLDLKYFHQQTTDRTVVPILVSTKTSTKAHKTSLCIADGIYHHILIDGTRIGKIIKKILLKESSENRIVDSIDLEEWCNSRYQPTPTIIEAAKVIFDTHTVENITRTEASGDALKKTTDCIQNIIEKHEGKRIVFVTGVPGAGKTLVGLNIAAHNVIDNETKQFCSKAVYLSGNGPLVKVLKSTLSQNAKQKHKDKLTDEIKLLKIQEKIDIKNKRNEFAKDKQKRDEAIAIIKDYYKTQIDAKKLEKKSIKDHLVEIEKGVDYFIQDLFGYRGAMLGKLKVPIRMNKLEIDESKSQKDEQAGHAETESIVIIDEAQRCWTKAKLAEWLSKGGSYGNKQKIAKFPYSEAEFMLWSMEQRPDDAVLICLVGNGQEIHNGEAGIGEWIKAVASNFRDWKVYVSNDILKICANDKNLIKYLPMCSHVECRDLHLNVAQRSFRADQSSFISSLLNLETAEVRRQYKLIKGKYPIVITRDITKAKQWLIDHARGSERYGIVASSSALRLRPEGIDVKRECKAVNWFLKDKDDLTSSFFMEDIATEFDVQGLEIDWVCVGWDADFRYSAIKGNDRKSDKAGQWEYYTFRSNKWSKTRKAISKEYLLNSYRVLLTRARQGMVIFIPEGNPEDKTRKNEFYDTTYSYLKKCDIEEI